MLRVRAGADPTNGKWMRSRGSESVPGFLCTVAEPSGGVRLCSQGPSGPGKRFTVFCRMLPLTSHVSVLSAFLEVRDSSASHHQQEAPGFAKPETGGGMSRPCSVQAWPFDH